MRGPMLPGAFLSGALEAAASVSQARPTRPTMGSLSAGSFMLDPEGEAEQR